ncbi:MAG: glycosyltransferase [Bacteroidetes bacterium]|nr:glycosyltransferase [Bacteroidota bacterium]
MPKVLRIINRFNLGGPTYNAAYLTKHLGGDYTSLLIGGQKEDSEDSSDFILRQVGVHPLLIPEMQRALHYNNDIKAYFKIKSIIERFKPDIVHTHASKAGGLGRMAAFASGVPIVVHTFHGHVFHSYFNKAKTHIFKSVERRLAKKTDRIIALSELQKHELVDEHRICEEEKISVIPLGFDLFRFQENRFEKRIAFRQSFLLKENTIAIGIIGRLVPIKNHIFFLQAIAELKKRTQKPIKAIIIGDGELRNELEKQCQKLELTYTSTPELASQVDVVFAGWQKDIDVINAGLDIVALTSLNEGTPVSLIEAQASGKPIVSTRVGGIENVVLPGKTALLSEPGDLDAFVENMLVLVSDSMVRGTIGELGWDWVSNRFHYSRLVKDVKNLYEELLDQKGHRTHMLNAI